MPQWDEHGNLIEERAPARPQQRREWDEQGRPTQGDRVRPGGIRALITGQQPRRPLQDAAGAINTFNRGAFSGFGDEISGGIGGVLDAGGEVLRGNFNEIGPAYQRGYRREADRARGVVTDFQQARPRAAAFAEGAGGAANMAATMGATAPQQAAVQVTSRGLPLFLNQTGRAATIGGAYGGAYGFGTTDGGTLEERLYGGHDDMAIGAGFGAAAPTAVNALGRGVDLARPAWQNLVRSMERLPTPVPNTVGAMGVPMQSTPPRRPPPGPPPIPNAAAGTIDRLADRAQMTPEAVERALAEARRAPQGQVLADVFGDPGVRTMRGIAQSPGQTGARAADIRRTRSGEQPGRILRALREGLRVGETRSDAMARLATEYDAASARLYGPVWERPLTQAQRNNLERVFARFEADPIFRRAMAEAEEVFARDRSTGLVQGNIKDSFSRFAHYLKLGMDDVARFEANPVRGGSGPNKLRSIRTMRAQIIRALDENVPGYREARSEWGGLINAEEALEEGADFFRSSPDAVRARLADMTEFERLHARIGLVDEITQGMRGGRVVGQRNVANALDFKDTQDIIAAAFDDPRQAAEFLDGLNTSNQLARNASEWLGGSQSWSNVTHAGDEALHAMVETGGQAMTGNPGGAVRRATQGLLNAATMGAIERANNVRGEALLRRVDTEDSAEFARQVVAELRRRQAARQAANQASALAAGGAGQGGARATD